MIYDARSQVCRLGITEAATSVSQVENELAISGPNRRKLIGAFPFGRRPQSGLANGLNRAHSEQVLGMEQNTAARCKTARIRGTRFRRNVRGLASGRCSTIVSPKGAGGLAFLTVGVGGAVGWFYAGEGK